MADEGDLREALTNWLEYSGNQRRTYKNGLAFALPGYMAADNLRSAARELMAIDALVQQQKRYNFNKEQLDELKSRHAAAADRLKRGILSLYEKVALPVPEETMYSWRFIDLQSRNEPSLHDRVLNALRDGRLLFDSLTPDKLIALTALGDERVIVTGRIVEWFYSSYQFTRLTSANAVAAAIQRGVEDGKFAYSSVWQVTNDELFLPNRQMVYLGRHLRIDEIDLDSAIIIDAELARELTYEPPHPEPMGEVVTGVGNDVTAPPTIRDVVVPPSSQTRKRFHLSVNTDKSKVFKVVRVMQNLVHNADRVSDRIEIDAETNAEYDPVWLRNAVEEPLDEADVDARMQLD